MFVPSIAKSSSRNSKDKINIYNFTEYKVHAFSDDISRQLMVYLDYSRIFVNKIDNALNNFVKMSS